MESRGLEVAVNRKDREERKQSDSAVDENLFLIVADEGLHDVLLRAFALSICNNHIPIIENCT